MKDAEKPGESQGVNGILEYFASNPVAANLIMAIMLIGGFVAASAITAQSFPTLNLGQINITVPYPGATPSEVEESITRRIEEAVLGIDGRRLSRAKGLRRSNEGKRRYRNRSRKAL